jgi:hypothetical protein
MKVDFGRFRQEINFPLQIPTVMRHQTAIQYRLVFINELSMGAPQGISL